MPRVTFPLALIVSALITLPASFAAEGKTVSLWDGKTFNGWEGDTNKSFRIQDGAIVAGTMKEKDSTERVSLHHPQLQQFHAHAEVQAGR